MRAVAGAIGLAAVCVAILAPASLAGAAGPVAGLDSRGWELVSPVDKNGGGVGLPDSEAAGVIRAAATGGALAYGSASSYGPAQGSLPVNQYIARRLGAWASENVTPPALSGTYDTGAYRAFSEDLGAAILADGEACRNGSSSCAAEGPPLGPGGPAGYRNLYRRDRNTYTPLVTAANSPLLSTPASDFDLSFAGADPQLVHVVVSTCSALVGGATEVPGSAGCDPAAQNLYAWQGGQLQLVNELPGANISSPGATLPAGPAPGLGPVADGGTRVYWSLAGDLYLREAEESVLVAAGAEFQAASRDGSLAFYLKAGHLYRYQAATGESTDLTPAGAVIALVSASGDGGVLYYVTDNGLFRLQAGIATKLIPGSTTELPPALGRARASADGSRLFFDSSRSLLAADTNASSDVYEWEAQGVGTCTRAGGCLGLISDGRSGGAFLVDAGASGDDVFLTTTSVLSPRDPDSALDVYDARAGGGEPDPPSPRCLGDDCPDPFDAGLFEIPPTATLPGQPNPPPRFGKAGQRPRKHKHKKRHRKRHHDQQGQRHRGGRR